MKDKACTLCQGQCKDKSPCNKLTGRCDNGCDNYRTGELCQGQFKIHFMFFLKDKMINMVYRDR